MQINNVELQTNNLHKTEAFYAGVLQLPLIAQTASSVAFQVGYSSLTFQLTHQPVGVYHFAILVPNNKIEEAYHWLKNKTPVLPFTTESDMADFTNWNARAVYFHDPFQNIVELIAHADLPYTADAAFTPAALVGMAEIGLVVPDVTVACEVLHHTYGVPYFSKGPYLKDFAVMGTEEALLILSAEGRGWLPTGQAAVYTPVRIALQTPQGQTEMALYNGTFS